MSASLWFLAVSDALKLQALVSFVLLAVDSVFPLAGALAIYLSAFALSLLLRQRRLAVYVHALAYVLGWGFAGALLEAWVSGQALSPAALVQTARANPVVFGAMLAAVTVFWTRGAWLAAKAKTHAFAVLRFDEGLAAFLCIFLIAAFLRVRALTAEKLVIPYLAFSIIALGLSKSEHARRGGLSPASTRRALVPVVAVVALVAVGVFFLMPALTEPARSAAALLKTGSLTLLSYIAAFLKWLFGTRRATFPGEEGASHLSQNQQFEEKSNSLFGTIMMYILGILVALAILALLAFLVVSIWRFLKRRVGKEGSGVRNLPSLGERLARLLAGLRRFLAALRAWKSRFFEKRSEAVRAFMRLRTSGRAAGLVQKRTETPREYASRLAARFPSAVASIELIISSLEKEIYGGVSLTMETRRALSAAARHFHRYTFIAERLRHHQ